MKPYEIRMLLDLWMSSDPWPLDAGDAQTLHDLLLRELAAYGFTDLSVAFHEFSVASERVTPTVQELVAKLPLYCDNERDWEPFADTANVNLNVLRAALGMGPR